MAVFFFVSCTIVFKKKSKKFVSAFFLLYKKNTENWKQNVFFIKQSGLIKTFQKTKWESVFKNWAELAKTSSKVEWFQFFEPRLVEHYRVYEKLPWYFLNKLLITKSFLTHHLICKDQFINLIRDLSTKCFFVNCNRWVFEEISSIQNHTRNYFSNRDVYVGY